MQKKPILDYAKCMEIANQCTCMHVRKASRALSQYFDRMMGECGLTISQFTTMVAIALMGQPSLTRLSEALGMDRTTLSRNLKPLLENGMVEPADGPDKRAKQVTLSTEGKAALAKAIPLWEEAQNNFVQRMGPSNTKELLKKLSATVVVASNL